MMSTKIKANKENSENQESTEEQNLELENNILQMMQNLREKGYYNYQKLLLMERATLAQERQAKALEESLESSEETNEELDV